MDAATKARKRKISQETSDFTNEEVEIYMAIDELSQEFNDLARKLHYKLFPETYDMVGDSMGDAKMRMRGKNPMSSEYTKKVNIRRQGLGFAPLGSDGIPTDNYQTLQYCKDLIIGKIKYKPNCK